MKNSKILILVVIVVLLVSAGSFFVGMKYQQSKQPAFLRQFSGQLGARSNQGQFQNRQGSQAVNGEIVETDNQSMTVKLPNGSSKIVLLSDSTTITQSTQGSKTDLKTGLPVAVFGTENSDGSVTAQNIQLNPL